jgi:ketosteroid isomerase-like protein
MADDKEAVLEAIRALGPAFVGKDLAAFEKLCTPDVVFIGSTEGEEAIGHGDAITAMWSAIEGRSEDVKFRLEWDSVDVNFVGDTAFVVGLGFATFETRFRTSRNRYRLTGVLQRSGPDWLWRVHHGSEPLPW